MRKIFNIIACIAATLTIASVSAQKPTVGLLSGVGKDPEASFKRLQESGFTSCQIGYGGTHWGEDMANTLKELSKKYNIQISTMMYCTPGGRWNFMEGPATIGLVPPINRIKYLDTYKRAIDFCAMADIPAMHSHFGFIPEEPTSELYADFIECMRELCGYAKERGVMVYCETGQETATTLIRAIHDIGTGNIFVNCDVANMILYGKGNPVDAVRQFGPLLKDLHAKDGKYPTNPYYLGRETKIPEGDVNFPELIKALKEIGFTGPITIECELGGNNNQYILDTKKYLEELINQNYGE